MTTDYLIAICGLLGLFSITAMLAGYADERRPTKAMVVFAVAAAGLLAGWILAPDRYAITELPNVVVRVIAYIVHS